MSLEPSRAAHAKMDRRASLANEFFEVTHAELVPFVSDEATWHDFDYLETGPLTATIHSHYGVVLTQAELTWPFWELLDFLQANRTDRA